MYSMQSAVPCFSTRSHLSIWQILDDISQTGGLTQGLSTLFRLQVQNMSFATGLLQQNETTGTMQAPLLPSLNVVETSQRIHQFNGSSRVVGLLWSTFIIWVCLKYPVLEEPKMHINSGSRTDPWYQSKIIQGKRSWLYILTTGRMPTTKCVWFIRQIPQLG